jgi:ATP-dependent exoDNAse (exonuclease V) beta subunit
MQKYYFESNNKEDLSEKLRLLYVALTRAINRVIVTVQYKEQGITKKSFKCYQDLIYQTIDIKNYQPIDFVIEDIFSQNKVLEISDELIVFEKLAFTKLQTKEISYSKKIQDIIDDDLINLLEKGDNYHQAISQIDWLDFENSIKHLPETLRDTMKLFFASEVFEELSNPMFFPEYEFYEKKGDYLKRGIIDLLIISDNSVSVIDFKLRNIDDYAYVEQLLGYYEYLESKVNKKIDLFLYSLFEMRLKRINL